LPTAPGWSFEFKWDGIRLVSGARGGEIAMRTRRGREVSRQFPELHAITALDDVILDGEALVLVDDITDWGATIGRLRARPTAKRIESAPVTVMVFDVLRFRGEDLRRRPYQERRAILEELEMPAQWEVPPVSEDGQAMTAVSLQHGLEGVVAKRLGSPYVSGPSRQWVKVRHQNLVDATVIGWRPRERGGITLLLAESTRTGPVYLGRCVAPRSLVETLEPLAAAGPPSWLPARPLGMHWVRPVLQVEVSAASREPDGRLRHPRLVRVRLDEM
jgi:bifunctional non-homologous end joining protein LigD